MRPGERGQASVELVALLPLTLVLGMAIATVLAARAGAGQASAAAQAGAMALIQDTGVGAPAAARAALPRSSRHRATVRVDGRKVTVTVRTATPLGFLSGTLAATASADAGPEPAP